MNVLETSSRQRTPTCFLGVKGQQRNHLPILNLHGIHRLAPWHRHWHRYRHRQSHKHGSDSDMGHGEVVAYLLDECCNVVLSGCMHSGRLFVEDRF